MKYQSGKDFINDKNKKVLLMGLSGVGKTTICRALPSDSWFHYSVDYRIWTHHLADQLNDYLKKLAKEHPLLRELLLKDSITIEHRIHFDNLFASSSYMGMLGNPKKKGTSEAEFRSKMREYSRAEIAAMLDIPKFVERAEDLYSYPHFLVDASGSLCEVIEVEDPDDEIAKMIEKNFLVIYIEATKEHENELLRRQNADPKPIYYREDFLDMQLPNLTKELGIKNIEKIDPTEIGRYLYPKLLAHRIPRYEKLSDRLGYRISMSDVLTTKGSSDLLELIADTIDKN